jgi:phage recombination protein Bet
MPTATAPATQPQRNGVVITYTPVGESESITLTIDRVKEFLCIPTRSGVMPTNSQVMKYMMLCKAQSLNPWVNDAYLVGYDSKDGPSFSLIVSHQALLKRAECSPEYDGLESGVIVKVGDQIIERHGKVTYDGEKLIGGWGRVHRKDRKISTYDSVNFKTYNTGRSRWAADPEGMIVKVAEAAALRKTFPSTLAAMYCAEEMERHKEDARIDSVSVTASETQQPSSKPLSRVEQAKSAKSPPVERQQEPAPEADPEVIDAVTTAVEPEQTPEIDNDKLDRIERVMRILKKEIQDKAERMKAYATWGVTLPTDPNQWTDSALDEACQYVDQLELAMD